MFFILLYILFSLICLVFFFLPVFFYFFLFYFLYCFIVYCWYRSSFIFCSSYPPYFPSSFLNLYIFIFLLIDLGIQRWLFPSFTRFFSSSHFSFVIPFNSKHLIHFSYTTYFHTKWSWDIKFHWILFHPLLYFLFIIWHS